MPVAASGSLSTIDPCRDGRDAAPTKALTKWICASTTNRPAKLVPHRELPQVKGNKDTSMNVKALILGIVVSAGISTVWADASPEGCEHSDGRAHGCTVVSAPEIHAAAGVNALALL